MSPDAPAGEPTPTVDPAGPAQVPDAAVEPAPTADDVAAPASEQAAATLQPDPVGSDAGGVPVWGWGVGAGVALLLVVAMWRGRATDSTAPAQVETQAPMPAPRVDEAAPEPVGLAARLRERMGQTRSALQGSFDRLFGGDRIDASLVEDLEEVLLIADVGVPTTERILGAVTQRLSAGEDDPAVLREAMRAEVRAMLDGPDDAFTVPSGVDPFVLLVVGVNGSGKTTTIGKLAARFRDAGHKVLVAAADTYRAAAADQLGIWAERTGAELVRHDEGADPGAVAFDALDQARARGCDVVLVDTAGRLQTMRPLMEELGKVRKVLDRKSPGAPHETWLVVDGTMGQNALSQARHFHDATPLTGVVVTKLDGTAKGGMVLAIASEMGLPVRFIGIGEQVDDLRPFEADAFVEALL